MTTERMIELLEIEHECMKRGAHDECDRDCARCELVQDDHDLDEMYTGVITLLKEHGEQIKNRDESLKKAREEIEWLRGILKEQEPIEPVDDGHGSLICGNQGYECGCVGRYNLTTKVVEKYCNFCPECGRKVKWE